jgi:hypothetical protein
MGPGIMGKMHPTMPAMAKINPMMMRTTFKCFAYLFTNLRIEGLNENPIIKR